MDRHPFDPVSAALGVLAVALGILVVVGELGAFESGGAWWIALAAVVVGIAIIPWRRRVEPDALVDGSPPSID